MSVWRLELSAVGEDIDDAVPVPLPVNLHEMQKQVEKGVESPADMPDTIEISAGGQLTYHTSFSIRIDPREPSADWKDLKSVVIDAKPNVSFGHVLGLVSRDVKVTFVGPYPTAENSK